MKKNKERLPWLGLLVVLLIAGNLRSPITAVSPILGEIREVLNLSNVQGSLLTSIPLIVFAGCSILISRIAAKTNINYGLLFSLVILITGLYFRVSGTIPMLYIGSFLLGLGICIGNVTTPAYIKNVFPEKIGIVTGIFSVAMNLLAALASGFSIRIGEWTKMGWKGSLGIWIVWAFLALIIVMADIFNAKGKPVKAQSAKVASTFSIFRSKQAWSISVFMGLQSLLYYCLVAFLPTILIEYGMDKTNAGWVISIMQLAMLPVMFIGPVIAAKMDDQKILIYGLGLLMFTGVLLLAVFKTRYVYIAAMLIGMASGLAFSLCLLFFSLKSKTTEGTLKISGKAQSVGYAIAACGPPLFGMFHDWDSTWQTSFYFLMGIVLIMTVIGRWAARPRYIEEH
ncbi:CynX/NimT family MFS transporter [Flavobacterium cerinum]|uniref:MFS transporter n=1 Tax=Flavobacterium cerinum TaxID=2502784 RepID=A0ABY5IM56_9FLAO|nr:MFS transporter [Flavobacterium cerinum]UUC43933.1 MFS transporter [Flavobacterium cerinum]